MPPHPCNSQHRLRAQKIALWISREEGVPHAASNPETSSEVTAEEEQLLCSEILKTNKAKAL